jgi:FdhD protein
VRVVAVRPDHSIEKPDEVVTEEPMEIRVAGPGQPFGPVAVTMRTPGHDFELAAGFLHGEGLVDAGNVTSVRYCDLPADVEQQFNIVSVSVASPFEAADRARPFAATASCGTCGKESIDQVAVHCRRLPIDPEPVVAATVIAALPDALRERQRVFGRTGGLHAAGLFSATGDLLLLREDVGRHNAVDKVVGHAVLNGGLPLSDRVLMVSGRVSFEIVQKVALAGIPVLCAVSAPSSLAIDAADRLGVTVVGFVRGDTCNIYTHPSRVALPS